MKTLILFLLGIACLLASSCAARAHAGRHSTGAGISTPAVGIGGSVNY